MRALYNTTLVALAIVLGLLIQLRIQDIYEEGRHRNPVQTQQQALVVSTRNPADARGPVILSPQLALLNDPTRAPLDDVRLLERIIADYIQLAQEQRRPIRCNEDLVFALTQPCRLGVRFMSPDHPAIVLGQLRDRWGQPYHIQALGQAGYALRSSGPDQTLFTRDDLTRYTDDGREYSVTEKGALAVTAH